MQVATQSLIDNNNGTITYSDGNIHLTILTDSLAWQRLDNYAADSLAWEEVEDYEPIQHEWFIPTTEDKIRELEETVDNHQILIIVAFVLIVLLFAFVLLTDR